MQTEKNLTFLERLNAIMKRYGISSINELAVKHLGYKASQKLNRLKDESNSPSADILADIIRKWPEINGNWLLLGRGTMIESLQKSADPSNEVEEPAEFESSLRIIKQDLKKVLRHQALTRAEIRAFGEYQVMKDAKNDDRRRIAIMAQISKLTDENLADDEIVDIRV